MIQQRTNILENVIWVSCVEAAEASTSAAWEAPSKAASSSTRTSSTLQTLFSDLII
jgi:hypothetical protein